MIYTEAIDNISNVNWCKVVVDNLNRAAQLFKKDFPLKGINTPLTGYDIFLMVKSFLYSFLPFAVICFLCDFLSAAILICLEGMLQLNYCQVVIL
jgi:hypothetical protein